MNLRYNYGDTLSIVLFRYCKNKNVLLEVLRQKPNLDIQDKLYQKTVGMLAFELFDDKDVLSEVINQVKDFDKKDYDNKTILDYAVKYYLKSSNVNFDIFKKLYDKCYEQNKNLNCFEYYLLI